MKPFKTIALVYGSLLFCENKQRSLNCYKQENRQIYLPYNCVKYYPGVQNVKEILMHIISFCQYQQQNGIISQYLTLIIQQCSSNFRQAEFNGLGYSISLQIQSHLSYASYAVKNLRCKLNPYLLGRVSVLHILLFFLR